MRDLVGAGYAVEKKEPAQGRGRPRSVLSSDTASITVAGAYVNAGSNLVELQIANLLGSATAQAQFQLSEPVTPASLVNDLSENLLKLLANRNLADAAPTIVAVSLPAMVDSRSGILHWLPPSAPASFPLAQELSDRLALPVAVDNSCNVLARAERWFDADVFSEDLCVVLVGPGLGLAQYVGGSLHTGAHGFNSEFGHVKTGVNADRECPCGAQGCLVQTSGLVALTHRANHRFGWSFAPLQQYHSAIDALVARAEAGHEDARTMLDEAGRALAIAIANHIAIWDPSRVLIMSSSISWLRFATGRVRAEIERNLTVPAREACGIEFRLANESISRQGPTALAIDAMISSF